MVKRIYYFELHGKLEANNEDEAKIFLENLLNKKIIESFKIDTLMTEAQR